MLLLFSQKRHRIEGHRCWLGVQGRVGRREMVLKVIDVELLKITSEHR